MITQATRSRYEVLYEACHRRGLLQEQVLCQIPYLEYFRQYGISRRLFQSVWESDLLFRLSFRDCLDPERAYRLYVSSNPVQEEYCPQWVHLYEEIQRVFPGFGFQIRSRQRSVVFTGYPCRHDGSRISLPEIATNPDILSDCVPERCARNKERPVISCAHKFLACGVWC